MPGRPEESAYDYGSAYDGALDDEFVPWRPGDPSVSDELPPLAAAEQGYVDRGRSGEPADVDPGTDEPPSSRTSPSGGEEPRRGFQWTEGGGRAYTGGERIKSTRALGGTLFSTVQPGTKGDVVSVDHTLTGGKELTVDFGDGHVIEHVKSDDIERRNWYDA